MKTPHLDRIMGLDIIEEAPGKMKPLHIAAIFAHYIVIDRKAAVRDLKNMEIADFSFPNDFGKGKELQAKYEKLLKALEHTIKKELNIKG